MCAILEATCSDTLVGNPFSVLMNSGRNLLTLGSELGLHSLVATRGNGGACFTSRRSTVHVVYPSPRGVTTISNNAPVFVPFTERNSEW